jgi:hypothetical protein
VVVAELYTGDSVGGTFICVVQVKTEFMQLWDGMESARGQRIVVMGATNRPGGCLGVFPLGPGVVPWGKAAGLLRCRYL